MKKKSFILLLLLIMVVTSACSTINKEVKGEGGTDIQDGSNAKGIISAEDWANEYPNQYASYLKNAETENTTYGGSEPIDYLEKYPNLKILYAGNGFSKEYLRARGHVYALEDVINTARPKPGASCLTCKTADYLELVNEYGVAAHSMNFDEVASMGMNTISCYDCHQNTPGEPVITRDHLTVALEKVDTEFKMGDLACAQCHVEYYLNPTTKEVVLPWDNGISTEGFEKYYDEIDYYDWVHPDTGTKLLKAQHPEFETYQGSLHSKMGLSCIDCHMPQMESENGEPYRSHQWTSPLKHMQQSCMPCHTNETEDQLIARVEKIQEEVENKTNEVSDVIVELINELAKAVKSNQYPEETLNLAREYHRKAQWRWDFVFVENSTGFHNKEMTHKNLDEARMYAEKGLELLKQVQ